MIAEMLLPANTRRHVLTSSPAPPWVVHHIVEATPKADPRWDKSEGERFSCRDALAHLADWDLVFTERLRLTLEEEGAKIEDADADERSSSQGYSQTSPSEAAD